MIFNEIELPGASLIEPERLEDEPGFFARTYDRSVFQEYGLVAEIARGRGSRSGVAGDRTDGTGRARQRGRAALLLSQRCD